MEYYLISLIISIIVFSLIQYYEYNRISNENQNSNDNYQIYSLFTTSNYLLFGIIYLLITIISHYIYSSNLKIMNFFTSKKNNIIDTNITNNIHNNEISIKDDINPEVISKIHDNFDTGFDPFNSDYDSESTISSISSKK